VSVPDISDTAIGRRAQRLKRPAPETAHISGQFRRAGGSSDRLWVGLAAAPFASLCGLRASREPRAFPCGVRAADELQH
jgi:hypothetical protein